MYRSGRVEIRRLRARLPRAHRSAGATSPGLGFPRSRTRLAQAKAADEARKEGKGVGPLHGVPVGIKDIIDTADMPTENGSAVFKGRQPATDAACVTALRRAGAVILGKTVTTELATLTFRRATRNPRQSRAHARAALRQARPPRLPPAWCRWPSARRPAARSSGRRRSAASYGFKPTFGIIPRAGVLTQSPTLDTVGVFGRSVEDVALIADALQGYDDARCRQPVSQPPAHSRDRHPGLGRCRRCSPSSRRMPGAMPMP